MRSIYKGRIESIIDAYILFDSYLAGVNIFAPRGSSSDTLDAQSGYIYIFCDKDFYGSECEDIKYWENIGYNEIGFQHFISSDSLRKKTWSEVYRQHWFGLIIYYI